jgi:hypothetical protein
VMVVRTGYDLKPIQSASSGEVIWIHTVQNQLFNPHLGGLSAVAPRYPAMLLILCLRSIRCVRRMAELSGVMIRNI